MGIYLNPGNDLFYSTVTYSEIYVDKTMLISFTNKCLFGENKEICVSRPRRFGKSMAENMLTAYYSKGCDSRELFSKFQIAQTPDFEKHLNRYNVIHIDMQKFLGRTKNVHEMLDFLQKRVLKEMKQTFSVIEPEETSLIIALEDLYGQCEEKFIFIIDEWDSIFRVHRDNATAQKEYLDFLRDLLKGQPYVALAYMTGILPIKKYGQHSALNMFDEYSMTNQKRLAEFTGFTEEEVQQLCERYHMSFEQTKDWYDGYNVNGVSIYNPRSVTSAMMNGIFDSYWTQTETYEALKIYIQSNEFGVQDVILKLLAGEKEKIDTTTFSNDMVTFATKDDVLTLLVHLGYLTYDAKTKEIWIPNDEVMEQFISTVKVMGWGSVVTALETSEKLLQATLSGDEQTVAELIEQAHQANASILKYNDENALSCVISLAYYSAQKNYTLHREMPAGKGFADIVFEPNRNCNLPAMIVELKWGHSAEEAVEQIKRKDYLDCLQNYHGEILLVGVNYDKEKHHTCKIERVTR